MGQGDFSVFEHHGWEPVAQPYQSSFGALATQSNGALLMPDTLARACAGDINPKASLDNSDGHGFFDARGDVMVCGPTLTNAHDLRAILVLSTSGPRHSGDGK